MVVFLSLLLILQEVLMQWGGATHSSVTMPEGSACVLLGCVGFLSLQYLDIEQTANEPNFFLKWTPKWPTLIYLVRHAPGCIAIHVFRSF